MFRVAYTRLAHDVISDTGAPDVIPATSVIRVTGAVRNVPAVAHTVWLDTNTINDTCAIHTAHAVHFPSDVAATRATDSAHPRCHATASRRRTNHYAGTAHTPDDNVGQGWCIQAHPQAGFFTASRPVTDGTNTGPVNRANRSVYRYHQFCYVYFSHLPCGFYYRTAAVRTVTAV
jgi:hypothetical protein